MTQTEPNEKQSTGRVSPPPPYAPGWINRLNAWVDRLPGPSWSFYLGLALVLMLVLALVPWIEGALSLGTLLPAQLFMPAMIILLLAMPHYLDNRSESALAAMRPILKANEEEYSRLRYEITTLPAWPTLLASLATVILILLLGAIGGRESSLEAFAPWPVSGNLVYLVYLIGFWNFGAFAYHTIHQLRVIHRIYIRHTRVNLFRLRPLYAFSSITALTAVTLAIITYGWQVLNPEGLQSLDMTTIGLVFLITALALAAFVWPLLGIHRLLVEEKGRLQDECSDRLEAAIAELHRRLDGGELEGMAELNVALANLEIEHGALDRIPTWPWQPETPRLLITALALPLGLWILQYILQLLLGL